MVADAFLGWLGQAVSRRRCDLGLGRWQLAARAGLPPQYVANVEAGRAGRPPPRTLEHLALALGFGGAAGLIEGAWRVARERHAAQGGRPGSPDGPADPAAGTAEAAERWLRQEGGGG